MRLILASGSPRRRQLLARLDIPFETIAPRHPEKLLPGESPAESCLRLATEKAGKVAQQAPGALVVGADTIVVLGDQVMGKPTDLGDARRMLAALSGRTHQVQTAVALVALEREHRSNFVETTDVTFHALEKGDIEHYLSTDPPLDKAGAYGIQDWSGVFVQRVAGCYHNVMGFPLAQFYKHLKDMGLWPDLAGTKHLEPPPGLP